MDPDPTLAEFTTAVSRPDADIPLPPTAANLAELGAVDGPSVLEEPESAQTTTTTGGADASTTTTSGSPGSTTTTAPATTTTASR